jgi:membrane associated rhomboid family serine protease
MRTKATTDRQPAGAWSELRRELKRQLVILLGFTALLWLLEAVDQAVLGGALDAWGIVPRTLIGLRGIVLAPLLHGGFPHLIANTGPLLVLGWFVMLRQTSYWFIVGALVTLVGGAGVWLVGATGSVHIGASIVVFGFLGYLLLRGWFERRPWPIVGSVVVGALYGGALWGILPAERGISWEGHLFGFLGGVLGAWLLKQRRPEEAKSGA